MSATACRDLSLGNKIVKQEFNGKPIIFMQENRQGSDSSGLTLDALTLIHELVHYSQLVDQPVKTVTTDNCLFDKLYVKRELEAYCVQSVMQAILHSSSTNLKFRENPSLEKSSSHIVGNICFEENIMKNRYPFHVDHRILERVYDEVGINWFFDEIKE